MASEDILPDSSSVPLQQNRVSTALTCYPSALQTCGLGLRSGVGPGLVFILRRQRPATMRRSSKGPRAPNLLSCLSQTLLCRTSGYQGLSASNVKKEPGIGHPLHCSKLENKSPGGRGLVSCLSFPIYTFTNNFLPPPNIHPGSTRLHSQGRRHTKW